MKNVNRKQPSAMIKKVWTTDNHFGKTTKTWMAPNKANTYKWSKGPFNGTSEGHSSHILKGFK